MILQERVSLGRNSALAAISVMNAAIDHGAWRGPDYFIKHSAMVESCKLFLQHFNCTAEQERKFIQQVELHWFVIQVQHIPGIKQSEQLIDILESLEVINRLDQYVCNQIVGEIKRQNTEIEKRAKAALFN